VDAGRVVVVGGTGFYGRYLVEDLLRHTDASVLVVARHPARGEIIRWAFGAGRVSVAAADLHDVATLARLVAGSAAVVHCAGPFQALPGRRGHRLGPLRAALAAGVPYVDISEDRAFGRAVLAIADGADVPVLTGASVVPGLEVIAAAELARGLDEVIAIRGAAAPDTRRHRGDAMFRAMLHGAGLAFSAPRGGVVTQVRGWSEPEWVLFPPPLGRRLVYQVYEMADLDLLVEAFGAGTVSFKAGSEFAWLNRALGVAAAARARFAVPRRLDRFTPLVRGFSWLVGRAGNEAGGFLIELTGRRGARPTRRVIGMTAERDGGRIPALLAAIATEELLTERPRRPGVVPLHEWLPAERVWSALIARDVVLWSRTDNEAWHVRQARR
jgi:Saccharopine dehydrogenase NADP binding domain